MARVTVDLRSDEGLADLGLSAQQLRVLLHDGVASRRDLFEKCETKLGALLRCPTREVRALRRRVARQFVTCSTAKALFDDVRQKHVPTNFPELDEALGGGVRIGALTELVGRAGSGKTQCCMQIVAACVVTAAVVYIDTEGSFRPDRLRQLALARGLPCGTAELERIMVVRPQSCGERGAALLSLLDSDDLQERSLRHGVRLLVLDSVAALARSEFSRSELRDRQAWLVRAASALKRIADDAHVAVVVTNQVMADFNSSENDAVTPALGGSWHHCVTNRVIFEPAKVGRVGTIDVAKSSFLAEATVEYAIDIRGIVHPANALPGPRLEPPGPRL
ncbi:P-loop containing nucleoside triphosphate hydrolase protein [Pelagophyceae sp. CCMP2097]|nr:P-loop containing nucleoside triphosphate hydrolase protein [Pelagophyceae sp. CCMP2097]